MQRSYKKLVFSTLITVLFFGGIGLLFNNCSGLNNHSTSDVAQMSSTEITTALAKTHGSSLGSNFCSNSENYSCQKKNFSPHVQNSAHESIDSICVDVADDTKICPKISEFNYNSQDAISNCTENCSENYDYSEYDCHLKLSLNADGTYPLVVRDASIEKSVASLHQACSAIQKGSVE